MAKIIKSKLDQKQNSNAPWLVKTIKRMIIKPVKKLGKPVFSFKRTQESAQMNSQILASFNGNLGASIEDQTLIPLDYDSEFQDINRIKHLLRYHEDK